MRARKQISCSRTKPTAITRYQTVFHPYGIFPEHSPDIDYDPVYFDISARKKNDDCKIVKIDHEQILCHNRIKKVAELAPTFEQLMLDTIDAANHNG